MPLWDYALIQYEPSKVTEVSMVNDRPTEELKDTFGSSDIIN